MMIFMSNNSPTRYQTATLAGGCFWCMEAVFQRLKGVEKVVSGYTGGQMDNPRADDVYSETTGHAEAIQITFDPSVISYDQLLDVFWHLHDPTTRDRQGNDVGTHYRSAIFYHNEEQRQVALNSKRKAEEAKLYPGKFVTEIVPFTTFYKAEGYHQDFYNKNSYAPYCQYVIDPKISKLIKEFSPLVKDEAKPI